MSLAPPQPRTKPARPFFSSGPCPKRPGWTPEIFREALLGRSHRSPPARRSCKKRLIARVPFSPSRRIIGSLSSRPPIPARSKWPCGRSWARVGCDVLAWDAFGESWVHDAEALKLADLRIFRAPPGKIADLARTDSARDIVFTWNGTSTGVCACRTRTGLPPTAKG